MIYILLALPLLPLVMYASYQEEVHRNFNPMLFLCAYLIVVGGIYIYPGKCLPVGGLYILIAGVPFARNWYLRDKELHDGHFSQSRTEASSPPPTDVVDL